MSSSSNWVPKTRAGWLVKKGVFKSLEDVWQNKIPIKEPEIADHIFKGNLKIAFIETISLDVGTYRANSFAIMSDSNG